VRQDLRMTSIERSSSLLPSTPPSTLPSTASPLLFEESRSNPTSVHYNQVRRDRVLIRYAADEAAVHVLLRFEGSEEPTTRGKLLALGFAPAASPAERSVSWKRYVEQPELMHVCARLNEAFGKAAVLDLGAPFVDPARTSLRRAREANYWRGAFLVHVGGTRRCVVFDAGADEATLNRLLHVSCEQYFACDFHAASE
jgi:hypothetical protein